MVVSKKEFEFLQQRSLGLPEILYFCELVNEIKKNLCFETSPISAETQKINDYMILDGVSFTNYDFINQFNLFDAFHLIPPLPQNETFLKFLKIKNSNGHIFALLTDNKIYLYATTQNIWMTQNLDADVFFLIYKIYITIDFF